MRHPSHCDTKPWAVSPDRESVILGGMNKPDNNSTQLTIRRDRPTAISSYIYKGGLDAVGFNLAFIALKNPRLAVTILNVYNEASKVKENDPQAPDEDLELFTKALKSLQTDDDV
jgi:hypothetical protein